MFEQLAAPTLTQEQINEMTRPSQQFAMAMSSQQMMSAQQVKDKIVNPAQEMQEALADAAQAEQAVQEAMESLRPQMMLKQQEALYELRKSMLQYQDFSQRMAAALDTQRLLSDLFGPYRVPHTRGGVPEPSNGAPSPSGNGSLDSSSTAQVDQSSIEWGLTHSAAFCITIACYQIDKALEERGLDEAISEVKRREWILKYVLWLLGIRYYTQVLFFEP